MTKKFAPEAISFWIRAALIGMALVSLAACETIPPDERASRVGDEPPIKEIPAIVIEEAESALAEGQYDRAQHRFRQILAADPTNTSAMLGLGEVFLATGDLAKALAIFRDLAGVEARRAQALQGEGLALLALGHRTDAIETLDEAVAADANLWRSWNALGQAYDAERRWVEAGRSYEVARELRPQSAIIVNNQGFSSLLQGQYEEATTAFMTALKLDPTLTIAQSNLRLALAWQGRYVEAAAGLRRDEAHRVLNNIGYIALLRGDYVPAEAFLTRAMETSPSFFEVAWRNLETLRSFKDAQSAQSSSRAPAGG